MSHFVSYILYTFDAVLENHSELNTPSMGGGFPLAYFYVTYVTICIMVSR